MKIKLFLFLLSQIFYIAKSESSFGLKLGNSINKSRYSTFTDSFWYEEVKLDNFFTIPYVEFFLNLNGNKGSIGFGKGNQGTTAKDLDGYYYNYGEFDRWKFYLSYQNTKILNNLLLPSNMKKLIIISPSLDMYLLSQRLPDGGADPFNLDIGLSAYYLKFGNHEPYISFSLPVTKPVQSWSFHAGLNINIPIGGKNKAFEDF